MRGQGGRHNGLSDAGGEGNRVGPPLNCRFCRELCTFIHFSFSCIPSVRWSLQCSREMGESLHRVLSISHLYSRNFWIRYFLFHHSIVRIICQSENLMKKRWGRIVHQVPILRELDGIKIGFNFHTIHLISLSCKFSCSNTYCIKSSRDIFEFFNSLNNFFIFAYFTSLVIFQWHFEGWLEEFWQNFLSEARQIFVSTKGDWNFFRLRSQLSIILFCIVFVSESVTFAHQTFNNVMLTKKIHLTR